MDSFSSVEGLPACPEDMNEVEYASLLFNPLCQVWIKNDLYSLRSQIPASSVLNYERRLPGLFVVGYARIAKRPREFRSHVRTSKNSS